MLDALRKYEYCVGYRRDTELEYRILYPTFRYWYADPIPAYIHCKPYIFMEAYDKMRGKGMIAVAELSDYILEPRIIIEESFHMSFPNVFVWNEEYYMIPETNDSGQMRLYKMQRNVDDWRLVASMDTGDSSYTDIAVTDINGDLFLVAGEKDSCNPLKCRTIIMRVISIDSELKVEIEFEASEYSYDDRNGGNIFAVGDDMYRVIQHSEAEVYGRYVTVHKIASLEESNTKDCIIKTLDIESEAVTNLNGCIPYGIHTYGHINGWDVIDIGVKRLSLDGIMVKAFRRLPMASRN